MEKFRTALQKRLRLAGVYNGVLIVFIITGIAVGTRNSVPDLMIGFNTGFCIGIQLVMIYNISKYIAALKSDEKLTALYIAENDDRNRFIEAQIGGKGINVLLGALALGTAISGFINSVVFITMLCALMFSTLVKVVLKLYYNKKV